jgi:hypothetical protein
MILTVEIPHGGKPSCWFAFDEDDFIRKVKVARSDAIGVIYGVNTPRELLAAQGLVPDAAGLADSQPGIVSLAKEYGWDTSLYRADYLLAPGLYQADEVSEFVAHVAVVAKELKACRVYRDEEQAMDCLYKDSLYAGKEGFYAHMALREQLIALEVMSDDL